jgi:hypothetical protein
VKNSSETHSALIEMNVTWLRQALDLLDTLTKRDFVTSPEGMPPHRVGSHLRHVIEFYECFLEGVEGFHIDYDARRRDEELGSSHVVAIARIGALIQRLENSPILRSDSVIFVKMEDSDAFELSDPYLMSSIGRELMTLSSHTIHHFALIAMTLRGLGLAVAPTFGVAPSTLRYMASKRAA